jgi:hypothetical protein
MAEDKMDKHLKTVSDAFVTSFLIFFGIACYLKYGANIDDFITTTIVGFALMLLTFAIALKNIDPITRQAVEVAQKKQWVAVEKMTLKFSQSVAQLFVNRFLIVFYGYYHENNLVADGSPNLLDLFFYDLQQNPGRFTQISSTMFNEVQRIYEQDAEKGVKLYRYLTDDKLLVLRGDVHSLNESWRLYASNPRGNPDVFGKLTDIVIKFNSLTQAEGLKPSEVTDPQREEQLDNLRKSVVVRTLFDIYQLSLEIYNLTTHKLKELEL